MSNRLTILIFFLLISFPLSLSAQIYIGADGIPHSSIAKGIILSNEGKGTPKSTQTIVQRNAIADTLRTLGMLCWVTDSLKYYFLKTGITNTDWSELSGSVSDYIQDSGIIISSFRKIKADPNVLIYKPGLRISGGRLRSNADGSYSDDLITLQEGYLNDNNITDSNTSSQHTVDAAGDVWKDIANANIYASVSKTAIDLGSAGNKNLHADSLGLVLPCYDSVWRTTHTGSAIGQTINDCTSGNGWHWSGTKWVENGTGTASIYAPIDTVLTNGTVSPIVLYVGATPISSVQTLTINGSGITGFKHTGDSLYIYYSVAPIDTVIYQLNGGISASVLSSFVPHYGVLLNTGSGANDLTGYNNLHVTLARYGYAGGSGTPSYYNAVNNGYDVFLTYNFAVSVSGNQTPFPTDTATFRANLQNFFTTKTQTRLIGFTGPNEGNNWGYTNAYWSGNASSLINIEKITLDEVHKHGKIFTNGGLTGQYLPFKVWEDFIARGYTDSAEAYRIATGLASNVATWRSNTSRQPQIYFIDTLISSYTGMNLDYINFHWYEPYIDADSANTSINALTFKETANYLQRVTGKPPMTNEFGEHNLSPTIVTQLLAAAAGAKMKFALWYAGNNTYSLINTDGSLRSNGTAYKNYLLSL